MDLLLGYVAGLLTLINPCVLPILPFVLDWLDAVGVAVITAGILAVQVSKIRV